MRGSQNKKNTTGDRDKEKAKKRRYNKLRFNVRRDSGLELGHIGWLHLVCSCHRQPCSQER